MRVTLIGSLAGIGGTERHLASLTSGLPGRGFEVELITSERGPLTEGAERSGVRSKVIPRRSRSSYLRELAAHLRRTRPDVVHAHSGRLPCLAARLAGVRWILDTRHGHLDSLLDPDEWEGTNDPRIRGRQLRLWRIEGWKGRLAHVTLTVCERDADTLVRLGRFPRERIRTIYNGVAVQDPASHDGPVERDPALLGWIGRMAGAKAPHRALDVLVGLLETPGLDDMLRGRLRLEMAGDGALRADLESRARKLGIGDRVSFPGPISDPLSAIRRYRAVLLPSIKEGLPYVLLEALSVGTPVLATPVGGIREILRGDLAGCLQPWDQATWTRTAHDILADESVWSDLHAGALRRSRDFTEDGMVGRIAEVYREGVG